MNKVIVEALPIREQVADIIRQMIISGELKENEQISERKIGQMLNVSPTPVREALRSLQTEGLIYTLPRKGSYVAGIAQENMFQIALMRSSMEGVAAYLAALKATDEEIATMERAVERIRQLRELPEEEASDIWMEQNFVFHDTLRKASSSLYLINILTTLRSLDHSFRTLAFKKSLEDRKNGSIEHEEILQAIKEHRAADAEKLMIDHIRKEIHTVIKT